jgi:hypothetical protein
MEDSDFEFVLFDLGGVLARLDGVAAMQRLAGLDSEEKVWRRWLGRPADAPYRAQRVHR